MCVTKGSSADKLGVRTRRLQHRDVHVARHLSTRVVLCRDGQDSHSAWHPERVAHRPLQSLPGVAGESTGQVCQSAPCTLALSPPTALIELSAFQTLLPDLVNTHCSCQNVCICKCLHSNRYAASLTVQLLCYCLPGVWANELTPVSQHLHPSFCKSAAASKPVVAAPVKST